MICGKCGREIPDDAQYCSFCGMKAFVEYDVNAGGYGERYGKTPEDGADHFEAGQPDSADPGSRDGNYYDEDSFGRHSDDRDFYDQDSYDRDSYDRNSYDRDSYDGDSYDGDSYAEDPYAEDLYDRPREDGYDAEDLEDDYNSDRNRRDRERREEEIHRRDVRKVKLLAGVIAAILVLTAIGGYVLTSRILAPKKARQSITQGDQFLEAQNYEAAAKAYEQAVEKDPSNTAAYNGLGGVYEAQAADNLKDNKAEAQSALKKAEQAYRSAIYKEQDNTQAWQGLGRVQALQAQTIRQDDPRQAWQYYQEAIKSYETLQAIDLRAEQAPDNTPQSPSAEQELEELRRQLAELENQYQDLQNQMDTSAEQAPARTEAPAEQTAVQTEAPAEQAPVQTEAPAEQTPVQTEAPAEQTASQTETPVDENTVQTDNPVDQTVSQTETPVDESIVQTDNSAEQAAMQTETPAEQTADQAEAAAAQAEASAEQAESQTEATPAAGAAPIRETPGGLPEKITWSSPEGSGELYLRFDGTDGTMSFDGGEPDLLGLAEKSLLTDRAFFAAACSLPAPQKTEYLLAFIPWIRDGSVSHLHIGGRTWDLQTDGGTKLTSAVVKEGETVVRNVSWKYDAEGQLTDIVSGSGDAAEEPDLHMEYAGGMPDHYTCRALDGGEACDSRISYPEDWLSVTVWNDLTGGSVTIWVNELGAPGHSESGGTAVDYVYDTAGRLVRISRGASGEDASGIMQYVYSDSVIPADAADDTENDASETDAGEEQAASEEEVPGSGPAEGMAEQDISSGETDAGEIPAESAPAVIPDTGEIPAENMPAENLPAETDNAGVPETAG